MNLNIFERRFPRIIVILLLKNFPRSNYSKAYSDTLVRNPLVLKSGLHKNINRNFRDREYRETDRQRDSTGTFMTSKIKIS
jgi:tRNA G37 N-methylase TrmD